MINAGSSRQRVVIYPISKVEEDRGRALINWVATLRAADNGPMPRQNWTAVVDRARVHREFAGFVFDFLDVPALIDGAETVYEYPMVDRDPLPSWNFGRVTLLGDAAHPMHPVGGNGASQAILDARWLARELATRPTIEAVTAYDGERRPATAAVVHANRRAGPHRCQDLVEERAPDGFMHLADVVSQEELAAIAEEYKATAGFDKERLNARPSLSVE